MRRAEKAHPRGDFDGICEKVVIFLEDQDFQQLLTPPQLNFTQQIQIAKQDGTLDVLCKLLKTWGKCSDDVIEYMRNCDETNPNKLQEKLNKALDTDTLKELLNEMRIRDHVQGQEEQEDLQSNEIMLSQTSSRGTELSAKQSFSYNFLDLDEQVSVEVKPLDVMSNSALKQRLQNLLEKYIIPLEEVNRNAQNIMKDTNYEGIYNQVQELRG